MTVVVHLATQVRLVSIVTAGANLDGAGCPVRQAARQPVQYCNHTRTKPLLSYTGCHPAHLANSVDTRPSRGEATGTDIGTHARARGKSRSRVSA